MDKLPKDTFAIIGINSDSDADLDLVRKVIEKEGINWRSFRDGRDGPISKVWRVQSWPTHTLIDANGRIRFKDVPSEKIPDLIEVLMEEAGHPVDLSKEKQELKRQFSGGVVG